jgi:hypothetical protein
MSDILKETRTISTKHPGDPGTIKAVQWFGPRLVAFRYRQELDSKEKLKTIELLLDGEGKSPNNFVCSCGNSEFFAAQVCHHRIKVNGQNEYEEEVEIQEVTSPYGPYTCTKCGKEYESLQA